MKNTIWKSATFLIAVLLMLGMVGCAKKESGLDQADPEESSKGLVVQRTISPEIDNSGVITDTPTPTPESTVTAPVSSPDSTQTGENPPAGTVAVAYVTADEVNVRATPDPDGDVLGKAALNTILYVSEKDAGNDWSEIDYDGKKAYIASYYLKTIADGEKIMTVGEATVNGSDINLRADSDTASEVLGKVSEGTKLEVVKKDIAGGWTMVLYEGKVAFIATLYLNF